jgi:pyrroline-5-carboxylate reductase
MNSVAPRLALIGAGRMGGALLQAWAKNYAALKPREILVVDPVHAARDDAAGLGCATATKPDKDLFFSLDTVVLAVKPQMIDQIAEEVAPCLPAGTLLISIVAGVSLDKLKALFPKAWVVRAMPNTPAALGKGATAFVPHPEVTEGQRERALALLKAGGIVEELADEKLLDVVTALSGSGPAYAFLLAEAMAKAAINEGLPPDVARKFAQATVAGAGAMLSEKGATPEKLRESVTSPGGTTEAALGVLRGSDGLYDLMEQAIGAAIWRARELARG